MKQSPARLIIYADQSEASDKNGTLDFLVLLHKTPKILSGLRVLKALVTERGLFYARLSEIANSGNQSIGKMYLEYPRLLPKASDPRYGEEYYYYEFNPNGTMASKYVNSWLIFGVVKLNLMKIEN